jgi:hypothetical protein
MSQLVMCKMEEYLKRAQHEGKTRSREGKTDNQLGTQGA